MHQLLYALQRKGWSYLFLTTVWNVKRNLWVKVISKLFPFTVSTFRKRYYNPLDETKIGINLLPEILRLLMNLFYRRRDNEWVFWVDRMHDRHTANKIKTMEYDILIGYENASLDSFRVTRKKGKINVLDLAQVHHNTIESLRQQYSHFRNIIQNEKFAKKMDKLKEEQNKYVDYFFVLSELAKQSLVTAGISPSKIYVLNLGFDPSCFLLKQQYKKQKFTLLFAGSITRRKGVHLVVEAFRQLNLPDCELMLVGPIADAFDAVENLPEHSRYISFTSHEELVTYYQNADVFVFPSYLDSWAMVVIEAMACGTPVIISENTGSKDAVKKGGGFIVPVDDIDAIKEKILLFYNDREMIQSIGRKAHEVAKEYTWDSYHLQIHRAIEDIARKHAVQ